MEKAQLYKYYKKDYFRPQLVRDGHVDLNGEWKFVFDDDKKGEAEGFQKNFPEDALTIKVPYSYETPESGIGREEAHECVWYSRELDTVRPEGDRRLIIHFEGSDYYTKVWVNGVFIGEHSGGYCRFSFDITDALRDEGANTLTVCCADSFDMAQPRGKQRWKPESFGCWYVQTTGIWKPVWAENVNSARIERVKITPDVDAASVRFEYELAGWGEDTELEAEITYKGELIDRACVNAEGKRVLQTVCLNKTDIPLKLWAPGSPELYDVKFTLRRGGNECDTAGSYFGMRKIETGRDGVRVNGKPVYQKLVLAQNYWRKAGYTMADEAAGKCELDILMSAGFNGLRIHQKIEDERFLMLCDVYGLIVWGEFPAEYEFCDAGIERLTAEWTEAVMQEYNHPCIITWVPFNESWGVPEIFSDARQQRFTQSICLLTKALDGTRPVVSNDGWEHTDSDVITLHDYDYSGEHMAPRYANDLKEILENRVAHGQYKLAFATGFGYSGQPIIISEYGGIAIEGGDGWGYNGKAKDAAQLVEKYEDLTATIRSMKAVSGFCYTQLTDVYQEVNGLTDMDRNPKTDLALIKAINDRF